MIDTKFVPHWWVYTRQVVAATVFLMLGLLLVDSFANLVVGAGVASSTFLVFCAPESSMAARRNLLGGHTVAIIVALALSPLVHDPVYAALDNEVSVDIIAAIAVGLTMMIMAVTNTEHAPAAGTALGLSMEPWSIEAALAVLVLISLLAVVQAAGRGRIRNLV